MKSKNQRIYKKESKIHISDLSYSKCDRYLYLLYSGIYVPEYTEEEILRMDIGTAIHRVIEEKEKEKYGDDVLIEEKLESDYIVGTADLIYIDKKKKTIKVVDIKTTNCRNFQYFSLRDSYIIQISLYKFLIMEKYPNYKVSGYIRPVCKCGIPSHFKKDIPVNADVVPIFMKQEERAKKVIGAVKNRKEINKNFISECQNCKAKKVCQKGKELKEVEL